MQAVDARPRGTNNDHFQPRNTTVGADNSSHVFHPAWLCPVRRIDADARTIGTAWLRLSMGALILLLLARPPLKSLRLRDAPAVLGLGIAVGLMSVTFLAAMERLPLGTAVAIEFLGPLSVAALRGRGGVRSLVLPATALAGVLLLTEPWAGEVDLIGVGFAAMGAVGWAAYVLLTQKVGDRFSGIGGLALTIPMAAVVVTPFGLPQAFGHITWELVAVAAALAVLIPVLPYILEMRALRRMTHTAFGTLLALEPAIGLLLGMVVLAQSPFGSPIRGNPAGHLRGRGSTTRRTPPTAAPHICACTGVKHSPPQP